MTRQHPPNTHSSIALLLQVTQDPAAADFILAHGTEALGAPTLPSDTVAQPATPCSLAEMEGLMQQCADRARSEGRSIPMIVANPDVVTVHGAELRTMPGTLARMYRQMGGEVRAGRRRFRLPWLPASNCCMLKAAAMCALCAQSSSLNSFDSLARCSQQVLAVCLVVYVCMYVCCCWPAERPLAPLTAISASCSYPPTPAP